MDSAATSSLRDRIRFSWQWAVVEGAFRGSSLPRRYYADSRFYSFSDFIFYFFLISCSVSVLVFGFGFGLGLLPLPLTVNHHQDARAVAQTKHQEALFVVRVILIEELSSIVVIEDRTGLLEGNAVTRRVALGFVWVPFELDHMYIICIESLVSSTACSGARRPKLTVNEHKSRVVKTDAATFLGFTFRGKKLRWTERAFEDFKHRIRQYTGRSWGVSMAYRFDKLARYARGWMNYYGISDYYRPVAEFDHWLRRRVRMCYWKRWRRARTKVRHLLALGTGKRAAILTAISSKSYWRLSKTLATQTGMTNAWLESQGLVNIRALWMKAHGYV